VQIKFASLIISGFYCALKMHKIWVATASLGGSNMNIGKMYFDFGYIKKNFNVPEDALFKCFNINETDESVEIVFYTNENGDNYSLNADQIPRVMLKIKNDNNFYDGIVSNLKQEARYLNDILGSYMSKGNMNGYIATLKSLKEVLNLISNYNWKTVMSEKILDINLEKNEMTVEIAIWQENCEGLKQNYKSWVVNTLYEGKDRGLVIDSNRNYNKII